MDTAIVNTAATGTRRGIFTLLVAGVLILLLAGCDQSATAFVLPEGDPEKGKTLFSSFQCTACHTVRTVELPVSDYEGPVKVALGGRVTRVKSYQELVTSIINPSHKLIRGRKTEEVSEGGESLMTVYNDVMTVSELIDLAAFLESQYERIDRPGYRYPVYPYSE